jgi:DNA-binding transcriptional ArsR family regulator
MPRIARVVLPKDAERASVVVGSPIRLAILRYLSASGPAGSGVIADALGLRLVTVSSNLAVLEEAGAVCADVPRGERNGRRVKYSLNAAELARLFEILQRTVSPPPT